MRQGIYDWVAVVVAIGFVFAWMATGSFYLLVGVFAAISFIGRNHR